MGSFVNYDHKSTHWYKYYFLETLINFFSIVRYNPKYSDIYVVFLHYEVGFSKLWGDSGS